MLRNSLLIVHQKFVEVIDTKNMCVGYDVGKLDGILRLGFWELVLGDIVIVFKNAIN